MKRPIVVSILATLLMATGTFGLVGDRLIYRSNPMQPEEMLWIAGVHLVAVVAGAFILRGQNWARWLAILWITCQVVLSLWHPPIHLLVQTIFFAVFLWCLFRGEAGAYFSHRESTR